jgi:poly(3-hydroxybutyrate) depolymerase/protein-S-isoprenylcysteine O-methyltransferase Ste14
MYRLSVFGFGLFAYASFGLSLVCLLGFLLDLDALPVTVDRGPSAAPWLAAFIDVLLICAFGLQHSVMARPAFKRLWTRIVPSSVERSVYVLISSVIVLLLLAIWHPLPRPVWSASTGPASSVWWAAFAAGSVLLVGASFQIDHFELLGVKQVWSALRRRECHSPPFSVQGLYKVVRHPIYVGWLMLFWAAPTMTAGHLLLAIGMTVYVLVAIRLEERDLVREHGETYVGYRERVPALLPLRLRSGETGAGGAMPKAMAVLVIAAGVAAAPAKGDGVTGDIVFESGGRLRTAAVYLPSADFAPSRLVLMLHGAGGDVSRIRRFTGHGLERNAAAGAWAVAYPQGIGGTWNDCRRTPPYPAKRLGVDDVGFLVALIGRLRARYSIPAERVLVAGFSNGGQMAIRLALERPDALGAVAIVAAQLPAATESVCNAKIPALDSLWVKGTADPFLPSAGGESNGASGQTLGPVLSVAETIDAFLAPLSGATPLPARPLPERDGDDATSVWLKEWRSAQGLLRLYRLEGSGHVVPQREASFPPVVGRAAGDADFGDIVLDFIASTDGRAGREIRSAPAP